MSRNDEEAARETNGVVTAVLPRAMYEVRLDDGRLLRCSVSPTARHASVRFLRGARVRVAPATHDPTRGFVLASTRNTSTK
ncbi:MAG: translation initiation factor IF-1 [Polyangiaceae bacterium]|nr:translation initiation factor IF-1 [Polyangiaceae bacterium]